MGRKQECAVTARTWGGAGWVSHCRVGSSVLPLEPRRLVPVTLQRASRGLHHLCPSCTHRHAATPHHAHHVQASHTHAHTHTYTHTRRHSTWRDDQGDGRSDAARHRLTRALVMRGSWGVTKEGEAAVLVMAVTVARQDENTAQVKAQSGKK